MNRALLGAAVAGAAIILTGCPPVPPGGGGGGSTTTTTTTSTTTTSTTVAPTTTTTIAPSPGLWSRSFGAAYSDAALSVATQGGTNAIAVSGQFAGTINLGGDDLSRYNTIPSNLDGVVAVYEASGTHRWSRAFGSDSDDKAVDVAFASNAVLVVGTAASYPDYGGGPRGNGSLGDGFVASYRLSDGAWQWDHPIMGGRKDTTDSVAVDGSNNVIIGGSFEGSTDVGGATITSPGGVTEMDAYITKYASNGTHTWSRVFGAAGSPERVRAIGTDSAGNTYVTGEFYAPVTFGSTTLTSAGGYDSFVLKLDPNGNVSWATRLGGPTDDLATAIAVAGDGTVTVHGTFTGTASFASATGGGTQSLTSAGNADVFVGRWTAGGSLSWAQRSGGPSSETAGNVTIDAAGNAYATGGFIGSGATPATFGAYTMTSGSSDMFVVEHRAADGVHAAPRKYGAAGLQFGKAIAYSALGRLVLGGSFEQTIDFGTGVKTSAGVGDGVFATINP